VGVRARAALWRQRNEAEFGPLRREQVTDQDACCEISPADAGIPMREHHVDVEEGREPTQLGGEREARRRPPPRAAAAVRVG